MSLTSPVARSISIPATGATSILAGFKVQRDEDLQVYRTPSGGSASLLVLGTHYTVTDLGETSAIVNLVTASSAGDIFIFVSAVDYLQELDLRNQGGYLPQTLEIAGLDRIVRMIQQLDVFLSSQDPSLARAMLLDVDAVVGSGAYNALSNRIRNMDDPTADQDAATKIYVDNAVGGVASGGGASSFISATVTAAALPTAGSTYDGKCYRVRDAGLPDVYKVCMKQSGGGYGWETLVSASS